MEYLQQFNPQITSADQPSQDNQSSGGFALRRSRSIELRAGKLYPTCDCIKRNGLQHECRRTECQGQSCCMTKSGPTCSPSSFASKLMNYSMGSGNGFGRKGPHKERDIKVHRLGEPKIMKSQEIPMASDPMTTEDYSEIKDFDPKMLGQIYQGTAPTISPYSQFTPTPIIGQPMTAFPQNFAGIPVSQPTTINAPQLTISAKSGDGSSKSGTQNVSANQGAMNGGMTVYPGLPQNFGSTAPITAIEPIPTIHPLPGSNAFQSLPGSNAFQSGMPIGQPFTLPAQSFAQFNGNMTAFNPYSPNIPSYLPCGPASMPAIPAGIPVGTAQ